MLPVKTLVGLLGREDEELVWLEEHSEPETRTVTTNPVLSEGGGQTCPLTRREPPSDEEVHPHPVITLEVNTLPEGPRW